MTSHIKSRTDKSREGKMQTYSNLRTLSVSLLAILVAGCTENYVQPVQTVPIDHVLVQSTPFENERYEVQVGDDMTVRFYYNPQLDEDVRVRPDGSISLSLIGEMPAAGKTVEKLSWDLTQAYAKFLLKPNANVVMRRFANARAFFEGEVIHPGIVDMNTGPQTVTQGISSSGGITPGGSLTDVVLVRRLPNTEPMVVKLNILAALNGTDTKQDVRLMPNDVIYIPRSGLANTNLAIQEFLLNNLNLSTGVGATKAIP